MSDTRTTQELQAEVAAFEKLSSPSEEQKAADVAARAELSKRGAPVVA